MLSFLCSRSAGFFALSILLSLLAACAGGPQPSGAPDTPHSGEGNYRFDAWRPPQPGQYPAIMQLLTETDELIARQAFDVAGDKLERILRISPDYAPAWSRLSWLALQQGQAQRAIEMARRSNSLAWNDPQLQSLNWAFIRSASQMLGDSQGAERANHEIKSLQAF